MTSRAFGRVWLNRRWLVDWCQSDRHTSCLCVVKMNSFCSTPRLRGAPLGLLEFPCRLLVFCLKRSGFHLMSWNSLFCAGNVSSREMRTRSRSFICSWRHQNKNLESFNVLFQRTFSTYYQFLWNQSQSCNQETLHEYFN